MYMRMITISMPPIGEKNLGMDAGEPNCPHSTLSTCSIGKENWSTSSPQIVLTSGYGSMPSETACIPSTGTRTKCITSIYRYSSRKDTSFTTCFICEVCEGYGMLPYGTGSVRFAHRNVRFCHTA